MDTGAYIPIWTDNEDILVSVLGGKLVANSELNTSYNLILSATMFEGLSYEIDTKMHRLNVSVPDEEALVRNLRIVDSNGSLHILCN